MKKLYLMKNPELFQGEAVLKTNKNYFEGWYFKNSCKNLDIAFIPGISLHEDSKKAFVQVITKDSSYSVDYPMNEFEFHYDPFWIKIGENFFSKEKIKLNLEDESQKLMIQGELKYTNGKNIDTSVFLPNIMGPFSYVPFMECNHAILAMENQISGTLTINHKKFKIQNGKGYIEKDWGCSFPKSYFWLQGNNFKETNASFMCSSADIPFKLFHFQGLICVLLIGDKEYKFTTYNHAKLIEYSINDNLLEATLKKGDYLINIKAMLDSEHKLIAPVKGKMEKDVLESIVSTVTITLKKKDEILFSDTSFQSGVEIVQTEATKKLELKL